MTDDMTIETDVLVCGAGIGGLTAARTAQEAGARVVVLEKAPTPGGSAAVSAGIAWTARDLDAWLSVQPGGDPALGQALVTAFPEAIEWLRSQGIEAQPFEFGATGWTPAFAYTAFRLMPAEVPANARAAMDRLAANVAKAGGEIRLNTPLRAFQQDSHGRIAGAEALGPEGRVRVSAQAVVMATGGFQGSAELRARYFGAHSDRMILRSNAYSTGEAFTAALAIGAGSAGPFGRFYGHRVAAPPAEVGFHNFTKVHLGGALPGSVLVNLRGERFVDEALSDEVAVHAIPHQPEALAFLIYDGVDARSDAAGPAAVANVRDAGGEILEEPSLEALAVHMAERWGVAWTELLDTLRRYNEAAAAGDESMLVTRRSRDLRELGEPPFYAIRFLPGITFTYGGVRINARAQVFDSSGQALRGLYAVGADAGGVYTRGYTGGLSLGLAFGRIAGRESAALAQNGLTA
jgi:succinate dehydrogenase/fumarate reductase flavoprotein subunit